MANNKKTAGFSNTHAAHLQKNNDFTSTSFGLIVHGERNQITVDSRTIAKEFAREHKSVLRAIDSLISDGTISRHEFVPRDYIIRGKKYRCYELNEGGFLKSMPFIGGKKSREGQKRLVDEFLDLRQKLDRQAKERATPAYQVARLSGKDARAILTDAIQDFVEYAKGQGSRNAARYFTNITNAVYTALLISRP